MLQEATSIRVGISFLSFVLVTLVLHVIVFLNDGVNKITTQKHKNVKTLFPRKKIVAQPIKLVWHSVGSFLYFINNLNCDLKQYSIVKETGVVGENYLTQTNWQLSPVSVWTAT